MTSTLRSKGTERKFNPVIAGLKNSDALAKHVAYLSCILT